jgi:hypothetical protein
MRAFEVLLAQDEAQQQQHRQQREENVEEGANVNDDE